ncbi:MAG: PTS sugar transporter subunit IIB [Calditrichia bacterium]
MNEAKTIWRVDDRLIHGQVVVGWCSQLPIKKLIVCDNEIATTDWEKELLLMAAPPDLPTDILTTDEVAAKKDEFANPESLQMVLVKSPFIIEELLNKSIKIEKINIGGLHFSENRKEYLSYVFLTDEEAECLRRLSRQGVTIECQDLPGATVVNLTKLLDKKHA